MELIQDEQFISADALQSRPHASLMTLEQSLEYLCSPDSGQFLWMNDERSQLTDGQYHYSLRADLPILIPDKLNQYFAERLHIPLTHYADAFMQYFLLATIKQSGEINAAPAEQAAQKHFYRMAKFLKECQGSVLDIGCDDPQLGASLFPETAQYIGLDPFCTRLSPFRVIGVAEYLPFAAESLDNVVFNTSLDHILDWRRALAQAAKVLKTDGTMIISTYIWSERADLMGDSVHFHHFRLYDILGALQELNLTVTDKQIYESPKGDTHRHGLYLKAEK